MSKPAQLLKYVEWQDASGHWLCNDTSDVTSVRFLWWTPARMMNISPDEYVRLLVEQFHPDRIVYYQEADVLVYSWKNINDCRKFKNWLNAQARKYNYIV